MFGIGSTELLVILVVALIVLGPKSIPQIAKTLGKAMAEFRRVSTDFQRTLNAEAAQEEHEQRKKEAEQELFGGKSAPPSSPPRSATPAARPTTADAPPSTSPSLEKPATAEAERASAEMRTPSPTAEAVTPHPESAVPGQAETPLERAVAKAAAEARNTTESESKPAAPAKSGESA